MWQKRTIHTIIHSYIHHRRSKVNSSSDKSDWVVGAVVDGSHGTAAAVDKDHHGRFVLISGRACACGPCNAESQTVL
jgi:hypothetical protein